MKRYYCDFCDRSFPYSVEAFRKHHNGHQHLKLRRAHYDQFKSARERLEEENKREKCRRFFSGQVCSFGESCVFSHLTPANLQELRMQAREEEEQDRRSLLPLPEREGREVTIETWMKLKETNSLLPSSSSSSSSNSFSKSSSFTLASSSLPLLELDPNATLTSGPVPDPASSSSSSSLPHHLPPSLNPPTLHSLLLGVDFAKWG